VVADGVRDGKTGAGKTALGDSEVVSGADRGGAVSGAGSSGEEIVEVCGTSCKWVPEEAATCSG
jgi:hypothetical protein